MKKPRPANMWGCVTDRAARRAESVLPADKDCTRETLTANEREAPLDVRCLANRTLSPHRQMTEFDPAAT